MPSSRAPPSRAPATGGPGYDFATKTIALTVPVNLAADVDIAAPTEAMGGTRVFVQSTGAGIVYLGKRSMGRAPV